MLEVVAGLVRDGERFLICQRPAHKARGLLWEFAGGKVEAGETGQQALKRELREELGIEVEVQEQVAEVSYAYPELSVHLTLYGAAIASGTPQLLEHSDLRWITLAEAGDYEFCPADAQMLRTLRERARPVAERGAVLSGDCIFCRIVRGELPCRKIFEDENALVFMDAAKDADGHMLAIPKKHVESILDCDSATLDRLMRAVQRVAKHCVEECGCEGVNLLNASGACAGQSVPHFHIHIIPRRHGDGIDAWPRLPGAKADAEVVFSRLRMD